MTAGAPLIVLTTDNMPTISDPIDYGKCTICKQTMNAPPWASGTEEDEDS